MLRRSLKLKVQFFLLLVAGACVLLCLLSLPQSPPSAIILNHPYFHFNSSAHEPEVDPGQQCLIPRIHPFHPSTWRFISEARPIRCSSRGLQLTFVDRFGWLRINRTGLSESGYRLAGGSYTKSLKCFYRPVLRGGDEQADDDTVAYGEQVPFAEEGVPIASFEVVMVSCHNFAGVSVYENIHAHIRNITEFEHTSGFQLDQRPNVLIFGLDSLSRQAFIRLLPRTYRYLTEVLSSLVYTGMNKVGDNTYPNLIALLTGKAAYGSDLSYLDGFDEWPLIWRNFSEVGYATLWAEDFPEYGLFNYLAKGFRKPPVHHYFRPFWLAVKESSVLRSSSHMCFGDRPRHQLQLEYLWRFLEKYCAPATSAPHFAFSFLAELSHEYLSQVGAADEDFEAFFRGLHEGGFLKNTLMIVMSDHGHRFDAIRSTQVGRLEERLPFFAIHAPAPVLRTLPNSASYYLQANRGRLTTPYDVHATLAHLLRSLGHAPEDRLSGFGRSLFGPVSPTRTCKSAGVPPHYCTCEPETPVPVNDLRVRAAVRILFNRINRLLRTVREFCADLLPGTVFSAELLTTVDKKGSKDRIRVTVGAQPSDAIFEATVEVRSSRTAIKSRGLMPYEAQVLGDISRINQYGNQSSCIKHDILRKYCYCQRTSLKPTRKLISYKSRRSY